MTRKTKKSNKRRRSPQSTSAVASAYGSTMRNSVPKMRYEGEKLVIHHREFVQDIVTDITNEFAYDVFELTPTNATTFPWLAPIAERFENFRLRFVKGQFRSGVGTTNTGKVIIAVDYDATDPDDTVTKSELLNWEATVSANMWMNIEHVSTEKNLNKVGPTKFCRDETTVDPRLSSSGLMYVATTATNAPAASPGPFVEVDVGEFYIEYEIELFTPVLASALELRANTPQIAALYTTAGTIASTTNLFAGLPPADAPVVSEILEPYGIKLVLPSNSTEFLQQGTNSTFASTITPLVFFERDFIGTMKMLMRAAGLAMPSPPPLVSVTQYTKNGSQLTPDLSENTIGIITNSENSGVTNSGLLTYSFDALLKIAAGTALRFATSAAYSSVTTVVKQLILAGQRQYAPKGDLLKSGVIRDAVILENYKNDKSIVKSE